MTLSSFLLSIGSTPAFGGLPFSIFKSRKKRKQTDTFNEVQQRAADKRLRRAKRRLLENSKT